MFFFLKFRGVRNPLWLDFFPVGHLLKMDLLGISELLVKNKLFRALFPKIMLSKPIYCFPENIWWTRKNAKSEMRSNNRRQIE